VTAYLPPETDAVLTVQAKKVADSDLIKKIGSDLLKEVFQASRQAAAMVEASGLDLMKDVDVVTVGMDLDKTNPPKPFALLQGKFDVKKVQESVAAYMKKEPGRLTKIDVAGKEAFRIAGGKPEETMYSAIIDDTRMVIAPSETDISGAFAAAAGVRKPVISKELTNLLATQKSTAPIFARAWVKGKLKDVDIPNDKLKASVQGVEWITGAIQVTKDVYLQLQCNAPSDESAKQLSDLLGGTVALIRLQIVAAAEDQPEMKPVAELLRTVKVVPTGKIITATGNVKGTAIEKALAPPEPKVAPKKK
jgi:hypothetical protein